jgi:sugar lactone lactonase YvrE
MQSPVSHVTGLRVAILVLVAATAAACGSAPTASLAPSPTTVVPATQTAAAPTASAAAAPSPTASIQLASPSTPTPTTGATLAATAAPTPGPVPTVTLAPPTVPPSSSLVEVAAGGGTADPGDGGLATDAHLTRPTGLAVASDGTIWIVDSNAGTLRTVTPDGLIHTVASGMYGPQGMCLTPDGTPYVAERGVYRLVTTDGRGGVKAVAGSEIHPGFRGDGGLAKKAYLSQPYDVVSDAAGNLYIADTSNQRVRFIEAATGKISTIAGNGTAGFAGDGGPATEAELSSPEALAVDAAGTMLYIADYGDSHLRRVDLTTGIITTVAGSGAGSVAYDPSLTALQVGPTRLIAVALDALGNVYLPVFFTDKGQMVMRMDPSGNLTVVTGGGTSTEPGVPATDFMIPTIEVLEIEPATGALLIGSNDGRVYRIPGVTTPVAP